MVCDFTITHYNYICTKMIRYLKYLYKKWFGKKDEKVLTVYSADNCRIDDKGGPYKVKIDKELK